MNTKQRMMSIRLADIIKKQPEYARAIGIYVIHDLQTSEGGDYCECSCGNRRGDVQGQDKR